MKMIKIEKNKTVFKFTMENEKFYTYDISTNKVVGVRGTEIKTLPAKIRNCNHYISIITSPNWSECGREMREIAERFFSLGVDENKIYFPCYNSHMYQKILADWSQFISWFNKVYGTTNETSLYWYYREFERKDWLPLERVMGKKYNFPQYICNQIEKYEDLREKRIEEENEVIKEFRNNFNSLLENVDKNNLCASTLRTSGLYYIADTSIRTVSFKRYDSSSVRDFCYEMEKLLKMNVLGKSRIKSLFTNDIEETVENITSVIEDMQNKYKNKIIDEHFTEEFKNSLHYENDIFTTVVPKTYEEMALEGQRMGNCMGGYEFDTFTSKGTRYPVFIRRKDNIDESYIDVDVVVSSSKLGQAYAKFNREIKEEDAISFVREYDTWLKNKMV